MSQVHTALTQHPEYVTAQRDLDTAKCNIERYAQKEATERKAHEAERVARRKKYAAGGESVLLGEYVPADPQFAQQLQYDLMAAQNNLERTLARIAPQVLSQLAEGEARIFAIVALAVEELQGLATEVQDRRATAIYVRALARMEPLSAGAVSVTALVHAAVERRSLLDPPAPPRAGQVEYVGFSTPPSESVVDAADFGGERPDLARFGRGGGGPLEGRR